MLYNLHVPDRVWRQTVTAPWDIPWKDAAGNEQTPEQLAAMIAKLTKRDILVMRLMALGWTYARISQEVFLTSGSLRQRISKRIKPALGIEGRGSELLVIFYVRYLLPRSERAAWVEAAERVRTVMRAKRRALPQIKLAVARLHADPAYADMTDEKLAQVIPDATRVRVNMARRYLIQYMDQPVRLRLVAVMTLAPLDA